MCGGPRIEERYNELWLSLLKHYELEKGIYPRIGREETKDLWEVKIRRMRCRERITESKGSLQWELSYYFRIKWLATVLSTALMKKWPEE